MSRARYSVSVKVRRESELTDYSPYGTPKTSKHEEEWEVDTTDAPGSVVAAALRGLAAEMDPARSEKPRNERDVQIARLFGPQEER